jgi:hypothetical protein
MPIRMREPRDGEFAGFAALQSCAHHAGVAARESIRIAATHCLRPNLSQRRSKGLSKCSS